MVVAALAFIGLFVQPSNVTAAVINVACPGVPNVLQTAINVAAPGDTIIITGNCAENVFIGIDFLTLTGSTAGDGVDGTVTMIGARGIALTNMTVKNSTGPNGNGITVLDGGVLRLVGVTISGHSRTGVRVLEYSFFRITGGTITDNGRQGVLVSGSSRANFSGVSITLNTREGVSVAGGSSVFIGNGSMISDNGRDGLRVTQNSTGQIDDVTISGNGRRSIQLFDSGFVTARNSDILSNIPDSASSPGGVFINRGSNLRLGGGNIIGNTAVEPGGGTAITVLAGSVLRQGPQGGPGVINSTAGRGLAVIDHSYADLRDFTLTGDVRVLRHSLLKLRKDTNGLVTGNIEVARDSAVSFALEDSGSVVVTGTVTCADTESSADFPGQTAADIVGGNGKELDCSGYGPGNSQP